jgi:PiT family inorganic phosphate transporter
MVLSVLLAAFLKFIALTIFGVSVAKTVCSGIISPRIIDVVILSGLIDAIALDGVTWHLAPPPTSPQHVLFIHDLLDASIAKAGLSSPKLSGLSTVVLLMVLPSLIVFVLAFFLMGFLIRLLYDRSLSSVNKNFKRLQLVSSSLVNKQWY